ncbi:golgin subfamily A member 4-like [Pieris brassicae]|uniref:golgin subfamily A member 4-like n=1 Tax=Pieris brassicae TaxID=7116 RepID=UPI001E662464|nr:golgin subfamily A member 4-like [Pieris brassicae]
MFKKFKDKLAEEVKSSPQRIQQFAQAAQAAVTSASSSISDITNNDLFSIEDSDNSTKTQLSNSQPSASQNLNQSTQSSADFADFSMGFENRQRQRRLSNSSLASDISFQLPNYESPSMYHLQSDMDVSASEAEEINIGNVNLNRVTKEQLYAAYRRTQERCKKYKTQYSDLARHYKLLERENAKARNVLVETQDKALRRISELKEQCSLENSAKAHLEQVLRVELDEKNMMIESLSTQLNLLQNDNLVNKNDANDNAQMQLINLNDDNEKDVTQSAEVINNKIEKLEQLLSKYKESLKVTKEKNSNLTTEIQKLNIQLDTKIKENTQLQQNIEKMNESSQNNQVLLNKIETLENLNSSLEFSKNKDVSILESNLKNSQEEIAELQNKIKILSKREEEYAISLAENKLRIHKELESKETEIKALKGGLENGCQEIETLEKTVKDHKNKILQLEGDILKLNNDLHDLSATKTKLDNLNKDYDNLKEKNKILENSKAKCEEDNNCLHLQLKQETAEKLSVIDRNVYLESRNTQLTDENTKKRSQINKLEEEVALMKSNINDLKNTLSQQEQSDTESSVLRLTEEATAWKLKCSSLESEIQDERVELGKLQSEVEKLLQNHEALQNQNIELSGTFERLQSENMKLYNEVDKYKAIKMQLIEFKKCTTDIRGVMGVISNESRSLKNEVMTWLPQLRDGIVKHRNLAYTQIKDLEHIQTSLKKQNSKITTEYEILTKSADLVRVENEKLKLALQDSETKCESISDQLNNITKDNDAIKLNLQQYNSLDSENKELCNKIKNLEEQINKLSKKLNKSNELYKSSLVQIEALTKEKGNASETQQEYEENLKRIDELENNLKIKQHENDELIVSKTEIENLYTTLEIEINELRVNYLKKETDYEALRNESDSEKSKQHEMQQKYEKLKSELLDMKDTVISLKDDNNTLRQFKADKEKEIKETEAALNDVRGHYESKLKELNEEKNSLTSTQTEMDKKLLEYEKQIKDVTSELNQVRESYEIKLKEFNTENDLLKFSQVESHNSLKEENDRQIKEIEAKLNHVRESYEHKLKKFNDEYEIHKKLNEDNVKHMETELSQARESYESKLKELNNENDLIRSSQVEIIKSLKEEHKKQIIDIEADLNSAQESYDGKLKELNNENGLLKLSQAEISEKFKNAQSDLTQLISKHNELEQKTVELNNLIKDLEMKCISQNNVIEEQEKAISLHKLCECDSLKEDNKRLCSDIEGLQTYLTKISKENSELNDKLREVLASENSSDSELKTEIQSGKDKIDELLRENSLLIEENLELKDQIQNSTQTRAPNSEEKHLNDKYKLLQEAKSSLEIKVNELEEMNDSLNRSMDQNQNNYERLKLSNEKLQRKLDEALVSLRHLHALEENTELEYLRNILYEYLTGPGSHSLTLAKVLAAVVKFDDRQTEQVLIKERERQGFLHQLGII